MSARYSRDPYNMLDQLKKMNLKHIKVKIDGTCASNKLMLNFSGCLWGQEKWHSFKDILKRSNTKRQDWCNMLQKWGCNELGTSTLWSLLNRGEKLFGRFVQCAFWWKVGLWNVTHGMMHGSTWRSHISNAGLWLSELDIWWTHLVHVIVILLLSLWQCRSIVKWEFLQLLFLFNRIT